MINIRQLQDLPIDKQIVLLHNLISYADRDYLRTCLQRFNIPGRTKIYKSAGFSWAEYNLTQRYNWDEYKKDKEKRLNEGITTILEHSSIEGWVDEFLFRNTLKSLMMQFRNIGIIELDIHTEIEPLRGLQTN